MLEGKQNKNFEENQKKWRGSLAPLGHRRNISYEICGPSGKEGKYEQKRIWLIKNQDLYHRKTCERKLLKTIVKYFIPQNKVRSLFNM